MPADVNQELELLQTRATQMGITYHPACGVDTLRKKIADNLARSTVSITEVAHETIPMRNARLRKDANQLTRVQLTCMNPAKKDWPGEIISVSNSCIGTIKKFIPFDAEDGYHIPKILLGVIRDRKYQAFKTIKRDGQKIKQGYLAKEFAIDLLDNLTAEELKALAARQALAHQGD